MSYSIWRIDLMIRDINNNINTSNNQISTVNEGISLLSDCLSLMDELIEGVSSNFLVNDKLFMEEKIGLIRLSIENALDNANEINSSIDSKIDTYRSELNDLQYQKRKLQDKDDEDV